jgi:hypothetical protein
LKNFQLIALNMDITPLLLSVKRRPDLWREDTYLRDYPQGPFGQVETIMLRFPEKRVFELEADLERYKGSVEQHFCIDYPAYKILTDARPLVMWLAARVGAEQIGRCFINKVGPGGRIFPHIDTPAHTAFYSRFHIVLESNDDALFRAGDEMINMRAGEVYWFDNKQEHEVNNNGTTDRIHLVCDMRCAQ